MSQQDRALELLLSGKTGLETAALVGVDPRTVRRWKKEPAFADELNELRQEIHDDIMRRAMAFIDKIQSAAFEQLEWLKLMSNKATKLTDKLRCISAINNLSFKWSKFIMDREDRKTIAQFARTAKTPPKADINGQAPGAREQTSVPFAPCCEPPPTPKADTNGHPDPEVEALAAHRAKLAASESAPKADKNGHRKWTGKGSHHVPFYRGVTGKR